MFEAMTKAQIVTTIVKALPYPEHIDSFDLESEEKAVRFSWRSQRFRVAPSQPFAVEECTRGFLSGSDQAILLEALLTAQWKADRHG